MGAEPYPAIDSHGIFEQLNLGWRDSMGGRPALRTIRTMESKHRRSGRSDRRRGGSYRPFDTNRLRAFLVSGDLAAIIVGYVLALRFAYFLRGHSLSDGVLVTETSEGHARLRTHGEGAA